jgi:hypothetical protein
MSKERTGYVYKRGKSWVARVTYTDKAGKQCSIRRSFPSKSEANKGLKQLLSPYQAKFVQKLARISVSGLRLCCELGNQKKFFQFETR